MKKVIFLVILAVAAAFAWQQFAESKLASANLTPEQRMLLSLEERIDGAGRQIAQASRAAGVSGMDTTSDVESALRELERAETELQAMKRKAQSDELRKECDRLLAKVESTRR